ncbi:MAG: alpha/beta fold hydrolase, partial [Myxococcota bacterium]
MTHILNPNDAREERTVTADDGEPLWTERSRASSGSATAVVVCHGGPGQGDDLDALRDLLYPDRTVVRWDQRGSGRSTAQGPFTLARSIADLDTIISAWSLERPWLLGHSWGATLALLYALEHPERIAGIVYLCGTGLAWWPNHSAQHKRNQRARLGPVRGARLDLLRHQVRRPAEEAEYRLLYLQSDLHDTHDLRAHTLYTQAQHL